MYRLLALGLVPIVALLVIVGAAGAAPKGGLTVDLKVAQSEFRASQDVLVTSLSRTGRSSLRASSSGSRRPTASTHRSSR